MHLKQIIRVVLVFAVFSFPENLFPESGNKTIVPSSIIQINNPGSYSRFYYDGNFRLKEYEQNIYLKTRDGYFEQFVRYEIEYDNNNRVKTIIKKQFSGLDTLKKELETIRIKCSYKGKSVRLYNAKSKTTSVLEIDAEGNVVNNKSSYKGSENIVSYLYDRRGNIIKVSNSYDTPDNNVFMSTTEYRFDNKKAVTANIIIPQWFKVIFLEIYGHTNNVLEKKYKDSMDNEIITKTSYKYRNDGYPSGINFSESENLPPMEMEIEYISQ